MDVAEGGLVGLCVEAATNSPEIVELWRRQRRTLERLPPHLVGALFRRLRSRRLLFPSLLEVFQKSIEDVDLKGEVCVDAEWMAYIGGFRYLKSLNIADCKAVNNHALWFISGMTTLKELDLSRCTRITDAGIKHLSSNTNLEKLYVSETKLTNGGIIASLKYLKNLIVLDLGGLPITDEAVSSLQVLEHLEHLDLWGSKISDKGASALKSFSKLSFLNVAWTDTHRLPGLPSLTCLNMSFCNVHSIFDDGSRCSAPLSKLFLSGAEFSNPKEALVYLQLSLLTSLDLSQSSFFEFHFITDMRRLEHLNLSSSRMTDELIVNVASIGSNLRDLDLSNTKITSFGISTLVGNVPKLQALSLSYTAVDDSALPYFGMIPSLKVIDLSYTRVRGFTYRGEDRREKVYTLIALNSLTHLESLNLEGILLGDDALHQLVHIKGLKSLALKSDHLSDISFHMLSKLPNLEFLRFCGTVLTNMGLLFFQPPSTLRKLNLSGCWLLTEDAISSFCRQFPLVDVMHESLLTSSGNRSISTNSSQAHGVFQARRNRSTRSNMSHPSRFPITDFMDERLKYSREELLELQHSPLLGNAVQNPLPDMLAKEKP